MSPTRRCECSLLRHVIRWMAKNVVSSRSLPTSDLEATGMVFQVVTMVILPSAPADASRCGDSAEASRGHRPSAF